MRAVNDFLMRGNFNIFLNSGDFVGNAVQHNDPYGFIIYQEGFAKPKAFLIWHPCSQPPKTIEIDGEHLKVIYYGIGEMNPSYAVCQALLDCCEGGLS